MVRDDHLTVRLFYDQTSELRSSADAHPKWLPDPRHLPFLCYIPRECALCLVLVQTKNEQTVMDFMLKDY